MPDVTWADLGRPGGRAELWRRVRDLLPVGATLPEAAWEKRHRGILILLALHAVGLAVFGIYAGASVGHSILEGSLVGIIAAVAALPTLSRRARGVVAAFGLMSSSGVLVHLSGGYIEAHFHFFVMLGVISLYEDWVPFILSVVYVAVHHGVLGTIAPTSVFNHPAALASPWKWALVHAVFVLGLCAANVVTWRVAERERAHNARTQVEIETARAQLAVSEKLSALGTLVSGVAHEIRTPLTYIQTSVHLAKRRTQEDPSMQRLLDEAIEGVERINRLVGELRRFHEPRSEGVQELGLEAAVQGAVDLFRATHRGGVRLVADLAPTPPVSLDKVQIQQLVLNLLSNAAEAAPRATIRVATRSLPAGAELAVEDDGPGIPPDVQARMWEPFFTTKSGGNGLGLAIVRRIATAHGATVHCESRPGWGTRFVVGFGEARRLEPEAPPVAPASAASPRPPLNPRA